MRIAFIIINHNKREGTSKAIAEVAERLAVRHDVHVFSRTAEGVNLEGIRWHRIAAPGYPHIAEFLGYVIPCAFCLRREEFDVIHAAGAVYTHADIYTIQNIQPAKRRILRSLEEQEDVGVLRRLTRWAYLDATSAWERKAYERSRPKRPIFLPVSSGVERELKEFYQIGDARCRIVPNAADIERFKPLTREQRASVRARYNLRETDFVCAFSGGEWRRKGLDLAIRALVRLPRNDIKLLVIGRDDRVGDFAQLARECGVHSRVVFAGFQTRVEEPLACADLFLFPSRYEAFSLATLEAAACELPVVAPKMNGAEDFIESGVNGEFVEYEPGHIASVIGSLAADVANCRRMGRNARQRVAERYTWDRITTMTEEVYAESLHARKENVLCS